MLSKLLKSRNSQLALGTALIAAAGAGYAYYKSRPQEDDSDQKKEDSDQMKESDIESKALFENLKGIQTKQFNQTDCSSLANIDKIKCTHYDIIMNINFENKMISGSVNYHFEVTKKTKRVLLDIRNINVSSIVLDGSFLKYSIVTFEQYKNTIGDQLRIELPEYKQVGSKFQIVVKFNTTASKESGLNWLNPSQTEGKNHPYLFTQSEPIWNRTIFPCQDSPAVKSTFSAQLIVPKPLKAYCSAKLTSMIEGEKETTMNFDQVIPIPSYLFAIVAGNLQERKISERTSVIAEPEVIDKCSKELEDMEIQLKTLEEIITPYEWQEYKIAVLPASFPYGGMENPLLTFASPSIIIGDKSGTDVVIHEMAHSWSGNLFSCKNWNSFWLNEGWTVYFECEAIRKLKGEDEYQIKFCLLDNDLKDTIDGFGHDHSFTTLNPVIGYKNPDDAFSRVPYVRGMQLLTHLSSVVGKELFTNFSKDFVNHFKYKSLDTADFKNYFQEYFGNEIFEKIDWEAWINKPGYPPQVFETKCQGVEKPKLAAINFLDNSAVFKEEWYAFSVQQKVIFLQEVNRKEKLNLEKVKLLDQTFELSKLTNPEVYTKWFVVALTVKYDEIIPLVQKHLSLHGRQKFVRSIYKLLDSYNHDLAVETFKQNESLYYGFTHSLTKADLKI